MAFSCRAGTLLQMIAVAVENLLDGGSLVDEEYP